MHGRIVRYLSSNGKGVVINSSKMLFEFTKETWHDMKVMPMVGMYVEFRCNNDNVITDCRVSKFQEFGGNTLISEYDFWHNDTDEQLETLQSNIRAQMVQKIYKQTNYDNITTIPLTIKLVDSIKCYFKEEFLAISFLNDLYLSDGEFLYDYFYVKKFVPKALDNLLNIDKTIKKDDFMEELSVVARLETAFREFERNQNLNVKNIFEQFFLSQQCHFQALLAAIDNARDSKAFATKRIASIKSEVSLLNRRIESKLNVSESKAKKEKLESEMNHLLSEEQKLEHKFTTLMSLKEQFEKHYFEGFQSLFAKTYQRIYKKIKSGLDICFSILDDKIYSKALHSVSFEKIYFKNPENEMVPITTYYIEQYLDRLNKHKLNEYDNLLYHHINKLKKQHKRYYLIVTSDEKEAMEMKLKILAQNKFNCVKTAYKHTMYFAYMSETKFDKIYVDKNNIWKDINSLIKEGRMLKTNEKTPFLLIAKQSKENRFGFADL